MSFFIPHGSSLSHRWAAPSSGGNAGTVIQEQTIPVGTFSVPNSNGGTGTGCQVAVGYVGADNAFTFEASAWNAAKNASLSSDTAANVILSDFIHVDFGGSGNSSVTIVDAKRGNISTGDGNDTVSISLATNDSSWQNLFDVRTGDGNDTMTGSQGKDVFVYEKAEVGNGFDTIIGFQVGVDELQFNGFSPDDAVDHIVKNGSTYIFLADDTTILLKGATNYFPVEA